MNAVHVIEHSPAAYGGEFSIAINVDLEQTIEAHASKALAKFCKEVNILPERQYTLSGI
ncbi:hypothetical protein [Coxiella-like endosymbiont of Rhipicephalus sanguineus]|uniref:hypothetical protein n=1 Tax=Coxiella-like endosymbiont of Rhipicephalus sanguineus TaxID=1955402 RepID=UPI00203C016A|nr:hypothetical protein [Coxiella-like endosymbiont of Rhipicephalus sanguineus]